MQDRQFQGLPWPLGGPPGNAQLHPTAEGARATVPPVGSEGIRRRKPRRPLPRLKSRPLRTQDEPPVMWSPGFEANPNSPAGEMQGFWRLTGRGSDAEEG